MHIIDPFHVALYYAFPADLLPEALHPLPLRGHPARVVDPHPVLALGHHALDLVVVGLLHLVLEHGDHRPRAPYRQVHALDLIEGLLEGVQPRVLLKDPLVETEGRVSDVLQHSVEVV